MTDTSVRARAYCSTANLGAGFDVFGLALNRYYDLVTVRWEGKGGVTLQIEGVYGNGLPIRLSDNSAGPPIIELMRTAGVVGRGVNVTIEKGVPPGLGLGSSGATAAACVKALDHLLHLDLSKNEMVRLASLGEEAVSGNAHADNVAASVLGGFTIVYDKSPIRTISIKPPTNLSIVVTTPKVELPQKKTRAARRILPKAVPIASSVLNTGRASAMVVGFAKGDIELIGSGMEDELAEPYRERMIPGYRAVRKAALTAEASGVAISGAGPSMIAAVDRSKTNPDRVGRAMVKAFYRANVESSYFVGLPGTEAKIIRGQR